MLLPKQFNGVQKADGVVPSVLAVDGVLDTFPFDD